MNQSGWIINCNFSFCLLHKYNRQAHTEMGAKYDSAVEGTHSFLPSCSLGTRGQVWCGHFLRFVQSSPSQTSKGIIHITMGVLHWERHHQCDEQIRLPV